MRTFMAFAVVLGVCSAADAGIKTFDPPFGGTSGTWNDPNNWSSSGVPSGADRVVIPSGKTCTVDTNATADTLDVVGTLIIDAGRSLTLENNSDNVAGTPDNSIVDGAVLLQGSNASPALLSITTASHAFSGSGRIKGSDPAGDHIEIGVNLTLTNRLATTGKGIRGSMTITGLTSSGQTNGTLKNEGLVQAADVNSSRLVLASTTILDDIQGAVWSVDACKGHLVFNRAATSLDGDLFTGTNSGIFEINASVYTCGTYTRNGGGIDISSGALLLYLTFANGTVTCGSGNPGAITNEGICDGDAYVVSSDVACCNCCPTN